jgi:hypothetical protein
MKIPRSVVLGLMLAALGVNAAVKADVWDAATNFVDNNSGTGNYVGHGAVQVHDLGVQPGPTADEDWYLAVTLGNSSYEVVVDGMTGDLTPPGIALDLVDSTGAVLTAGSILPGAFAKHLTWENTTSSGGPASWVRVRGAGCGTGCTTADEYTIRFYETTYAIPRFNNAGSQVTVLILQNTNPQNSFTGNAFFWSATGTLLATRPTFLSAHQVLVLNTSTVPGLLGVGGSITITTADGRYGQLVGKTVALEPSTGFSFDSPMAPKPL